MLKPNLYEELNKHQLCVLICSKRKLKDKLQQIEPMVNLQEDTLIIQVCEKQYRLYYSGNIKGNNSIQISLALRFRMEIDIDELDNAMLRIDEAILHYPFDVLTEKYCMIRYMDLCSSYFIIDMMIGSKDKFFYSFYSTLKISHTFLN